MPAATAYSCARVSSPCSTIAALAVVPPMSKVMTFLSCFARASACAPTTPPAGPDSMMWIGRAIAADGVQIVGDDWRHISVDHRCRGAFIFLDLGQYLTRNAQREPRRLAPDDVLDHQLMRRVSERVDEADRDRFDRFGEERIDGALRVGRIERALDRALMIDAFVHHLAQIALDQWLRFGPADVIEARHAQGADLQHVPEPLGGDESDPRPLALEDGVGG